LELSRGSVRRLKKLQNEKLHNLNASPNTIRVIKSSRLRRAGYVAPMEDMKNAYRILVGKPEGRRPLGKWEDNIRMDLR
jgi:hypothetical protein